MEMGDCILCGLHGIEIRSQQIPDGTFITIYTCPRCNAFVLGEGQSHFVQQSKKWLLSGYVRRRNENIVYLNRENLADVINKLSEITALEKQTILLEEIESRTEFPGAIVKIDIRNDYPLGYCKNTQEFKYLIDSLADQDLINVEWIGSGAIISIKISGWERLAKPRLNIGSNTVFIGRSFEDKIDPVILNAFLPAITDAGYRPIDVKGMVKEEKVDDLIFKEIRRSRFVVVDVTSQRPNVHFEAGFAIGLGIPVIFCCEKSEIGRLHFDTRQYDHISWEYTEYEIVKNVLNTRIMGQFGRFQG